MSRAARSARVYSTETGRTCPRCGWPASDCRCAAAAEEPVPARVVARLRIERAGRGGKTVTVVDGLPRNAALLADLARDLKRATGSGGAAGEGRVEIQGDRREAVRKLLAARGWTVKG